MFDTQLFYALHSLVGLSPTLDSVILFLAADLAYVLIALFLGLVFFSAYSRRDKIEILLVSLVAALAARFGVTEMIRYFYHHPRPFVALPEVNALLLESSWSFPSGHATFFFAMATAVYLYDKPWGRLFFGAAVVMTLARVIAGVHYPSDILAGALLGALTAILLYEATRRWLPNRPYHDLLTE